MVHMDAQTSFLFDPRHTKKFSNWSSYLCRGVSKRSAIVTSDTLLRTCEVVMTFRIYSESFPLKSSTASSHIVMLLVIVQHIFDIFKTRTRLFLKNTTPKTEKKLQKRLHTANSSYGVGKPTQRDLISLARVTLYNIFHAKPWSNSFVIKLQS